MLCVCVSPADQISEHESDRKAKTALKVGWAKHWLTGSFTALEAIVAGSAGQYSVGDSVSVADVYLVPQVVSALRFGVDVGG